MLSPDPRQDISEILLTPEEIQEKVRELGQRIEQDYRGQDLILVCVLKGATVFLSDLMRHIQIPLEIDFMAISSYNAGETESSGVVRILMDLAASIEGRNVLIVEDIIDTGRTLAYILENLQTRNPKTLKICALLNKPQRREVEITIDYLGFRIPNKFVVGYGLDFGQIYRNLPFVGVLKPELYTPPQT